MAVYVAGTCAVPITLDGVTMSFTGAGATTMEPKSLSFTDSFTVQRLNDKGGNPCVLGATGRSQSITISYYYKDESNPPTKATAKANIKFPDPLVTVTLAGFGNTTSVDGTWNYVGGNWQIGEGFISATMNLERFLVSGTWQAFSTVS